MPRQIVQFWHDLGRLPGDVRECVESWTRFEMSGFKHCLFDQDTAKRFIADSLSARHARAFERCYHPSMQADYFRLCYLLVEGGFYVDADDICLVDEITWLFRDGRLKLQPLCYDLASNQMVKASIFLRADAYSPEWIFYFNNNPLIARKGHPIVGRALAQATDLLDSADENSLPEIQATTGPGNLSKSIFDLATAAGQDSESDLFVLRDWDSIALSRWPLSYRDDARNWRHSNQQRYIFTAGSSSSEPV